MKISSYQVLLVATTALSAHGMADYTITPGTAMLVMSEGDQQFVKQWTLTDGEDTDSIDAIDLVLAGNAFISYASNLPRNVIGYVNISGNSEAVVNGVSVTKDVKDDFDIDNIIDELLGYDNKAQLNIRLGNTVTSGFLLTEIFLAIPHEVSDVTSRGSVHVVIEDNVLMKDSKISDQSIQAQDNSTVFVLAPDTDVDLRQLNLQTTGHANINYNVADVSLWQELDLKAYGSSSIKLLSSIVTTTHLSLNAAVTTSQICISADKVDTISNGIRGEKQISLPNSVMRYGTTGTFACKAPHPPARKAAKIVGVVEANLVFEALDNSLDDDNHGDDDNFDDSHEDDNNLDDNHEYDFNNLDYSHEHDFKLGNSS